MTVEDFYKTCDVKSRLRVLSGYNGKILCYAYDTTKHAEIGKREISCVWAEITVTKSCFGDYASPIMCCYVDGAEEYRKARKKTEEALKDSGRG